MNLYCRTGKFNNKELIIKYLLDVKLLKLIKLENVTAS